MNWSMSSFRQLAIASAVVSFMAFAPQASAAILDKSSAEYMGYYVPGEPASETQEASYINILAAMGTSTSQNVASRDYFRSTNTLCFSSCETAVAAGAFKDDSGGNTVDFGADGWTYLIGKYDGPNGGSMVWYVSGLTGEMDIPLNGPEDLKFGLSHYTLFNPGDGGGGGGGSAPEPGSLALVGLALLGVASARKRLS